MTRFLDLYHENGSFHVFSIYTLAIFKKSRTFAMWL